MKKLLHLIELFFVVGLSAFVSIIPWLWLEKVSKVIVFIFWPLGKRAFERIRKNIIHVYPDMSEKEIKSFIKENLQNTVRTSLEVMQARKFQNPKFIKKYISPKTPFVDEYLVKKDEGIVVVQGHIGNYELAISYFTISGVKVAAVVKKQSNQMVDKLIFKTRQNYGARILYMDDTTNIIRLLKNEKYAMGLVADQDAGGAGEFVDFLGRKASTYTGPAVLSYLTQTEVIFVSCLYQGKGRYEVSLRQVIPKVIRKNYPDKQTAIREITQAWSKELEKEIRLAPKQYFWLHRRWKTKPPEQR